MRPELQQAKTELLSRCSRVRVARVNAARPTLVGENKSSCAKKRRPNTGGAPVLFDRHAEALKVAEASTDFEELPLPPEQAEKFPKFFAVYELQDGTSVFGAPGVEVRARGAKEESSSCEETVMKEFGEDAVAAGAKGREAMCFLDRSRVN